VKRLLVIDPESASAALIVEVLGPRGVEVRIASAVDEAEALFRGFRPDALWIFGEPTGLAVRQVLASEALRALPAFVIGADAAEAKAARAFRTGIVEIFALPFDPLRHLGQALAAFQGLAARKGAQGAEGLPRFLQHVRRTQRSGLLQTGIGTPQEGRAQFVRGKLKAARRSGEAGEIALLSMRACHEPWRFTEGGVAEEPRPSAVEGGVSLLFVDDDPEVARMFSVVFRDQGYEVTTAPDGVEAFALAARTPFDLAVADLNMPRLDGWGLMRKLRHDFRTHELPVAFLSAHDDYREALRAKDAGAKAYFAKGTRLESLVEQVHALLSPRVQFREAVAAKSDALLPLGAVGTQWAMRHLVRVGAEGRLSAEDGWATYQVWVKGGELLHAVARSGTHEATGPRAFNAFLGSSGANGRFTASERAPEQSLGGPIVGWIEEAWKVLNRNAAAAEEALLQGERPLSVDRELYALYAQLGPKQWLEAARLLCEERLTPREVLARSVESPVDLDEVLRDLVRRGVITPAA
jgi:CheY-like chemotaxis protein